MIVTPEFAINPKGFKKAEAFSLSDAIPVEKGSGFGNHLDKLTLIRDTVMDYVEVSSMMTINVNGRDSDLFIRMSGAGSPWLTIEGNLRNGRKIVIDASSLSSAGKLTIGGVTHDISSSWGTGTFYWTSSGVSSHSAFFGNVHTEGNLTVDGYFEPGQEPAIGYNVNIAWGDSYILPRGVIVVGQRCTVFTGSTIGYYSVLLEWSSNGGSAWSDYDSRLPKERFEIDGEYGQHGLRPYHMILSNGSNFRIRNVTPTHTSVNVDFYKF